MGAITEFMSHDHQRLDALLAQFREERDPVKAREIFSEFEVGVRAHMVWEDNVLFPALEERTDLSAAAPLAALRAEHQELKTLFRAASDGFKRGDAEPAFAILAEALTVHFRNEEEVLYPWFDRILPEKETAPLLDQIRKLLVGV